MIIKIDKDFFVVDVVKGKKYIIFTLKEFKKFYKDFKRRFAK